MSSTDHPTPAELAKQLAGARASKQLVASAPFDALATLDSAYQLQNMATEQYDSAQIGYKVGATNEAVQKLFGANAPFLGPMFERDRLNADTTLQLTADILGGEAEFAFVCGDDFPDRDLSQAELPDLISSCHIAVEIVGRRTIGEGLPTLHAAVADYGANVAFIEGPSIDNWQSMDLAAISVTASTDGVQTNEGTGAAVLGHPLQSMLWLHETLRMRGNHLRKGDWVSTGTCLGVIKAVAGSQVDIDFAGCGHMRYQFSPATA
jgi:2-keto-4-pentenoate hydratase